MPRLWLALLLLGVAGFAWSQPDARSLISESRALKREALNLYDQHTPDQPLWRQALELAQEAHRLEPNDPEVIRFLALTYSEVSWYVRAYTVWLEYLEGGGELDHVPDEAGLSSAEAFSQAGTSLGYSRYQAGDLESAVGYYETVLTHLPEDVEALYRLGHISLERGEEQLARDYFERLLAVEADHEGTRDLLALIEERSRFGGEASRAYREGLSAYEAGRLADAHASFVEALSIAGEFAEAAVWAGRTALELEQPGAAVDFWGRAVALQPDSEAARYFLEVARTQARWGVAAGRAYYEGQSAYEQGDLVTAAAAFVRALQANPQMADAWVWAARSRQEAGRPEEAIQYWQGALDLRPDDERAQYFLDLARHQMQYGQEAGTAFVEAVRHYQLAEFDQAEAAFGRAVQENPGFAAAWGWLGRVHFTRAEYGAAATAYRRAFELEPNNHDYAFFAEEAERLAGEGQ